MKTKLFLCMLLCIYSSIQAQNTTVNYPAFSSKSTDCLEITRIERSDKATILHMEGYSRPNTWIRLDPGTKLHGINTGKDYKLLSSEGFELDKEVYMPASGNVSFKLFFEPLSKTEKKIDFIEGQGERDFIIKDIQLTEDYKKQPVHCHLSGTVINRPQSSRLMLMKDGADFRTSQWLSIPIHNGKFDYDFYTDAEQVYLLTFWEEFYEGAFYTNPFFAEKGNIQFTLYPSDSETRIQIETTAPLTSEMLAFNKQNETLFKDKELWAEMETLEKSGRFYTEAYKAFWDKFDATKSPEEKDKLYRERAQLEKDGVFYTDEAKAVKNKIEILTEKSLAWQVEYCKQHLSLFGLYKLKDNIVLAQQRKKSPALCIDAYNQVYADKFPGHPFQKEMQEIIKSLEIKVGKQYIDFTAPDLTGKNVTISDEINGKVALIDLWASWCGPCRRNSISMIGVYNKYKDKGFTVVGVAREKDNAIAAKEAITKDGYPWLNLVELNDKARIWSKYGISNAAGGTYLIDKDGCILAINPSIEEVEAILQKKL